jgi:Zn finger protein HypA/HybF involved in hydrogenase expression
MNLVVCAKCTWIGVQEELGRLEVDSDNSFLQQLIDANNLACLCCPKCQGTTLYQKAGRVYSSNIPELNLSSEVRSPRSTLFRQADVDLPNAEPEIAESELAEDETLDSDVVADLLNAVEKPLSERKSAEEKPKRKRVTRPPVSLKTFECDECGQKFKSKIETNRCDKCNEAYMKKFA